ncbi:hypothetical protein AB0G67_40140 [Streptomyces sp. NPDC021056]|uniref:hypothetical protein n=1 Tax=Streptomyces sp. NPDC021056 TaxID=3155012 RepID=UPI0033DE4BB4
MGQDTAGQAGRALKLLNSQELRETPTTGPSPRHTTASTPRSPLNVDLVDHLTRTVGEVAAHARAVAPHAGPLPERVEDLYDWYIEHTGDAGEADRRYRDILIERHRLEHVMRLGYYEEVRKHPCPECGCWGLMWDPAGNRALCSNRRCRTPDGMTRSWTLARLAAQKIQRTEIWRRNAT